ncbi:hypothetical protein OHA98_41260 [Streptomyces sp. NBC_00654]|uniref:hypothetical protein n=1 Tax=Streptomyces sp. NBC_00654 TaxID=2975799 RepID=UPI00225B9341|nr:hypothetical protein [Streptomyces sp. NBC_00654]MCX4971044.1 hypothetical protein [Streptomyces sp. NBC_00654]
MEILTDALPEFLGALGSAGAVGTVMWCFRTWRRRARGPARGPASTSLTEFIGDQAAPADQRNATARRYTLLGTLTEDGSPKQLTSTRSAGTVIVWPMGHGQERFELTDVQLYDGTFAAEPATRYEAAR